MLPITSNPPGLAYLRVAIAGHAFAWYSLYNLFVLWLVSRGISDGDAASAFGNLVFAAYVLPLLGGVVADGVRCKYFTLPAAGLRATAISGAATATLGYAVLTLTSRPFLGVALVALGCGFIKPAITTMVGRLFPTGGHIADRAYSRFYAAINLGATAAPLLGGWLMVRYGFHAAFAVGALGDVVAGFAVLLGYRALAVADARSELAAVLAAAVDVGEVQGSDASPPHDRRKTTALLLFFIVAAVGFWPAYSQNGSGLSLWAAHHTELSVLHFSIPPVWFAAVNSILCIVAASPMAIPHASWIISCELGAMTSSSMDAAIKLAADAAIPSTMAVTRAECRRSRFVIAIPSHTSPPGELMCRRIEWIDSGSASRTIATSFAETPHSPPQLSTGS